MKANFRSTSSRLSSRRGVVRHGRGLLDPAAIFVHDECRADVGEGITISAIGARLAVADA
jgi:hypothetical protein